MAKKSSKLDTKDYEKLGKLLVSIGETGVADKKKLYKLAFIKGIIGGLGGVLGATIVVGAILIILSLLGDVPFVGQIAETVEKSLQNR